MRRLFDGLSRIWRSVVFVMTLRAVAKPYRSRRLYPAENGVDRLDMASTSGSLQ